MSRLVAGLKRTSLPKLVPVYEHGPEFRLGAMGQEILEFCGCWGDVVDHELDHQVILLCQPVNVFPGALLWIHLEEHSTGPQWNVAPKQAEARMMMGGAR